MNVGLPGQGLLQGYKTGVEGSPQAAAAPWAALGEVGREISQLGEQAMDTLVRLQRADNLRKENEMEISLHDDYAEFRRETLGGSDPTRWPELSAKWLEERRAKDVPEGLSPEQRDGRGQRFNAFASRVTRDMAETASVAVASRATESVTRRVKQAIVQRDPAAAHEANERGFEQGLYGAEERDHRSREIERQVTVAVKEDTRQEGMDQQKQKGELWQGILKASLNEGAEPLSMDTLRVMQEQGLISGQQRFDYEQAYHGGVPPERDPHAYHGMYGRISRYDPLADRSGMGLAQLRTELATAALPVGQVRLLEERLERQVRPANPETRKISAEYARLTESGFEQGKFGTWFRDEDHDGSPATAPVRRITKEEYERALGMKQEVEDTFEGYLQSLSGPVDRLKVKEVYDGIFESVVLDRDESAVRRSVPAAPKPVDLSGRVDAVMRPPGEAVEAPPGAAVGDGPRLPGPGQYHRGAHAGVTGGVGGGTRAVVPQALLQQSYPGKDAAWLAANVKVVVKTEDGRQAAFPLAAGAAEPVTMGKRPAVDLTEGAVRALGGWTVPGDDGRAEIEGLGALDFALVAPGEGLEMDLRGLTWSEATAWWFRHRGPGSVEDIHVGLAGLRSLWSEANGMGAEPAAAAVKPGR